MKIQSAKQIRIKFPVDLNENLVSSTSNLVLNVPLLPVPPLFGLYTHYPLVKSIKVLDFNLIFKFILVLIFTTLTLNIYKLGSPPSYSFPILVYSSSILDSKLHVLVIIFFIFKNILFSIFIIFCFYF